MKLIACVNHVPDTATKVNVASDGKSIDRTGVNFIINPYDEFAVEECLRQKEKNGGEVIAVSLGTDVHKETLRKCLAMGVDKAVLLKDDGARDTFGVAKALAEYLREQAADVIFFGKQSVDGDDAAVGPMVAELLGIPSVTVVVKVAIAGTKVTAEREIEGGHEIVETSLPCVITAQKGLNDPRYPSLKGIMGAKNKPIEERPASPDASRSTVAAMRKPKAKAGGKIVGTDASAAQELVRLLHEEAKVI
ncbi:MAG: electron transfer flavoprotein subunit beta [Ignavibacteria bacterium GWA2_55_11]|nr:MAG: electron transfer flavoprotein subunit beta [Ignavibacteria bacterium GWA2_55_11]OGU45751.1 MAG: electron transfer flavoprotein subunit beta [Ignavibacteria bacterium GWC2_56_12]HAV22738.1 electron transfer flavoprotein subunit beta [Bacteroidota bacterium]